ncbi:hypothetical protein Esti_002214 [Eimeria stiedai]
MMGGPPSGGGAQELYFSPSVEVQEDVGPGRGAGVVARAFIKAGELLAWRRGPLVWSARASPDCRSSGAPSPEGVGAPSRGPPEAVGKGAPSLPITACDACLRPYDHCSRAYGGGAPSREEGPAAKRCSACKSVYYCSAACQRSAWTSHKKECGVFDHIRKVSKDRGPSVTQRLLVRLLLSNHATQHFAQGHAAPNATTTTPPQEHLSPPPSPPPPAEPTAAVAKPTAAAAKPTAAGENDEGCMCHSLVRSRAAASLSSHLKSCAASAVLLERLLSVSDNEEAVNKENRGEGPPSRRPPSPRWTASAWGRRAPSAEELRRLLHLLSANVHSVPWMGWGAPVVGLGGPNECMQVPAARACVCCQPGNEVALAVYGQPLCRFNHSCAPNAWMVFGGPQGPLELFILAARSIPAGEEVCISYVSLTNLREQRREKLLLAYNFVCTCVLCCSCTSSTSTNSNSSSSSSGSSSSKDGDAVLLPEAFDLQLRGVFCPSASCVEARTTAQGDVFLALRESEQQLLHRLTDSSSSSSSSSREQQRGASVASELHESTRRLRLRLPVLMVERAPSLTNKGSFPLLFPPTTAEGAAAAADAVASSAAAAAAAADQVAASSCSEKKASAIGENDEVSLMSLTAAAACKETVVVRCNACGTAYRPEEVGKLCTQLLRLRLGLQSLSTPQLVGGEVSSKRKEENEEKEALFQQLVPLFAAVRRYAHPANALVRRLTDQLSFVGEGLGCSICTSAIGLATAQRQALAAAALHGRLSPQHAERLTTAGQLLLFFAQADNELEATEALLCWIKGDAACTSPAIPPTAAAAEGGGRGQMRQRQQLEVEVGALRGSSRARLACEARECFLLACSVFFACSRCEVLRAEGRRAEKGIADCERELHALGFSCDTAP